MRYELSQAYTLQPPQCWYHSTQFFVQSQWHQSMHWFECRGMAPNCTEPPRAAAVVGRRAQAGLLYRQRNFFFFYHGQWYQNVSEGSLRELVAHEAHIM